MHRGLLADSADRRTFIGGSDARIIMGDNEPTLNRLWREKRGEAQPEDLSDVLIVQLGTVTEDLNRRWYERNSGCTVTGVQRHIRHPVIKWMAATLDGLVEPSGAVFEAKFMLPWTFSEEAAAEKHMAQLQHNMWVANARSAVLSIITGGGKWVEIAVHADPLYQHLLLTAEKKFWRCVMSGEQPGLLRLCGKRFPVPRHPRQGRHAGPAAEQHKGPARPGRYFWRIRIWVVLLEFGYETSRARSLGL
jgi:predicted phage-related endonuclease